MLSRYEWMGPHVHFSMRLFKLWTMDPSWGTWPSPPTTTTSTSCLRPRLVTQTLKSLCQLEQLALKRQVSISQGSGVKLIKLESGVKPQRTTSSSSLLSAAVSPLQCRTLVQTSSDVIIQQFWLHHVLWEFWHNIYMSNKQTRKLEQHVITWHGCCTSVCCFWTYEEDTGEWED